MMKAYAEGSRLTARVSADRTAEDAAYTAREAALYAERFNVSPDQAMAAIRSNVAQANANPGQITNRNRSVAQLNRRNRR